jgi:Asp-tRNA(Asn)/Glu-tRNA(Gln) amidotransferase A subunit family amidase
LTDYSHEEALESAKAFDEIFAKTGKPVRPLHGLPVSIKVEFPHL